MEFKDRLKEARKAKGLTQAQLAEKSGVTQAAIQSLENGRVKSTTFLLEIAKILEVSPDWLRTGKKNPFNQLAIVNLSQNESDKAHFVAPSDVRIIPILNWEEARSGIEAINNNLNWNGEFVPLLKKDISEKGFGLYMKGDSMISDNPHIKGILEGELIFIDPEIPVEHSKIVIAVLPEASEAICRKYVVEGGIPYLVPLNKQWEKIKFTQEIKIIGVMMGRLSKE